MTYAAPRDRPGLLASLQDWAEELIYDLNERDHWLFRLYDLFNEWWARVVFRATRRRAAKIDIALETNTGEARFRFLEPDDAARFASLLEEVASLPHVPPHPLDRAAAEAALARQSYLPFGIFADGELVGYLLLRLFFPRRAVLGIWLPPTRHNAQLGRQSVNVAADFLRSRSIPNFITVPIDNTASLRVAEICGYELLRTNRRFHVLRIS